MKSEKIPILVVSDTHFGRGVPSQLSCRPTEFARFLDWVLHDRTVILDTPSVTRRKLSFPQKVVLLGDILELWAPLKDRLVFERGYLPLAKLQEVGSRGCEIIYVVGNHDYTISEYQGEYGDTDVAHAASLRVIEDLYSYGRYVFLHGHQLTKAFRFPIWKALGYIHKMVASFGKILKSLIVISFFLCLAAWYLFRVEVLQISFVLGLLTAVVFVRELAFPTWIYWKRLGKMVEKAEAWLHGKLIERPQYKEFTEIVNEGSLQHWWNQHKRKFTEKPEVIIFGHTHRYDGPIKVEQAPNIDFSEIDDDLRTKVMVNTGCWLKEEDEDRTSFLYITEEDEILLCGYDSDRNLGVELPGELTRFASRQMPWSTSS